MYSIAAQLNVGNEMSGILSLYENGTIKDSLESPYCSNKQKISLSSYTVKIKKCNNEGNRCQFPKKPLSSLAVILLHEKCSLRKECDYVNFSSEVKELKNDTLDSVLIDYQCLGGEDRLYEMCGHQTETITSSVHLITGKESRQYSSCQCLLQGQNNSVITVILKDIRLYSTKLSPRKCSESVLNINKKSFTCNSTSSAFGSVFNQPLSMKTHNETLTVSLDVEDPEFDMMWILVKTKGSMSVECSGKRREVATKFTEVFGHSQTSDIQSDKNNPASDQTIIISVCVGGGTIILAASFALLAFVRRRCGHTEQKDDYIQPVYKSSHANQDKVALERAFTCSYNQQGACGSSVSPGTTRFKRIDGIDKTVNHKGDGDPYYLELREGSDELIYDSIQETHAVYEQIKQEKEDRDPGYAELDSIKCDIGVYCTPRPSQLEISSTLNKTECLKDSGKYTTDGYCVPFRSRQEKPANVNNLNCLTNSVIVDTDGYCVPFTNRPETPANANKPDHLKEYVQCNTDEY